MKRLLCLLLLLAGSAGAAIPRRIVSLSPTVTELLYGIGAFDQVVGVSEYCTWPPAVVKLPRLGGWHNPSLEKLAALRPDLVILDEGQRAVVEDRIREMGLPVLTVPTQTLADLYSAIATLGAATGHSNEAATLIAQTRAGLERTARRAASLPKVKTILIVNRTPGTLRDLYTATTGSFLAEIVEIAGGRIAAPPTRRGYAKLTKEELLAADPDVILDFIHGSSSRFADNPIAAWKEMPELRAVRANRIFGVDQDFVPHASQRVVQTGELFFQYLHPGGR